MGRGAQEVQCFLSIMDIEAVVSGTLGKASTTESKLPALKLI